MILLHLPNTAQLSEWTFDKIQFNNASKFREREKETKKEAKQFKEYYFPKNIIKSRCRIGQL